MLYKMMIAFSSEVNKQNSVKCMLNQMMNKNVVFPRVDHLFYVKMALAVGDRSLAQKLSITPKSIFGYSRSIEWLSVF